MPELAAAKALDLGVVPTGPCLGAEPPVLVSERSVSLEMPEPYRPIQGLVVETLGGGRRSIPLTYLLWRAA